MIIKDEKLGKYHIDHDGKNYVVLEKMGINKKGEDSYKTHAYCSSMTSALTKIIKLQVEEEDSSYDLKGYIKAITDATQQIKSIYEPG